MSERQYRQARAMKQFFKLSPEAAAKLVVGLHGDTKDVQAALERDDDTPPRATGLFPDPASPPKRRS